MGSLLVPCPLAFGTAASRAFPLLPPPARSLSPRFRSVAVASRSLPLLRPPAGSMSPRFRLGGCGFPLPPVALASHSLSPCLRESQKQVASYGDLLPVLILWFWAYYRLLLFITDLLRLILARLAAGIQPH